MAIINLRLSKGWSRILGSVAALILIAVILSYLISSDLLRNYIQSRVNSHLKGYRVQIGKAYFHPIAFSIDLDDLILTQNAHPDPPVASVQRLHTGIHWRELLYLNLVAEFSFIHPKVNINLINLRKESESKTPFKNRGWQEALESVYPLKINVFTLSDGELTYTDIGPYKPLRISGLDLRVYNIRNIRFPDSVYPSSVHLTGKIFDKGALIFDGNANFLEEPHLGMKGEINLADMELSYFRPVMSRSNLSVRKGTLSANGTLEYSPRITSAHLRNLDIKGMDVDYLHLPKTVEAEQRRIESVERTAKELSNKPAEKILVDVLRIEDSTFGYVDNTANPHYRLFIDHTDMTLKNLVLPGFLWIHIQLPAEEQYCYSEVLKVPESPCC